MSDDALKMSFCSRGVAIGLSVLLLFALSASSGQTYFVDAIGGNDARDGLSEANAWKTLGKVNAKTFLPGDAICLKRGSVWSNVRLHPLGSGTAGKPITLREYGDGSLPQINTAGNYSAALLLSNQSYWEIQNIEISNRRMASDSATSLRYGVYVTGSNAGALRHIIIRNLVIHQVNGNPTVKTGGGIYAEITGSSTPTWFDSLIVEGCDVHDVGPVGISNISTWDTRTFTTNTNWTPSLNVVLRNNSIRRTARNGMIIRVAANPLIEYNVFEECALTQSGNALFVFNCDGAVMQYNEAFRTRYNPGDADAGGFDADYRCKNTLIQYNYSHDNEYGGVVIVSDGGGSTTFNDGTIVRYNVFKDNLDHVIRTSGNVTNTLIYNNTIYSSADIGPVNVFYHKSWGGYSDDTRYFNNIVELLTPNSAYSFGASTNNQFEYNLFHGLHPSSEPVDAHKITEDPGFRDPGSVGAGWASTRGLRLLSSSPAVNSGMTVPRHSPKDYLGTTVPSGGGVDRGAFEDASSALLVAVKCYLQGPFNAVPGRMNTSLRTSGTLALHFAGRMIPAEAVDSITVEIRDAAEASAASVRMAAPAWLLADGSIRNFGDTTAGAVSFDAPSAAYFVVVHHRNHLAIMSAGSQMLDNMTPVLFDFTTGQEKGYGVAPMVQLGAVAFGMYSGDADGDGGVGAIDRTATWNNRNCTGYLNSDVDLNGSVDALDRTITWNNRNRANNLP